MSNTEDDVDALIEAVAQITDDARSGRALPVPYEQDLRTGDFWPVSDAPGWRGHERDTSASCARG
jgi:hypothetical protein